MFCRNAASTCLPPYVVYSAEHMWPTWTENNPDGARYNRTKNGWFDSVCFEDWFQSIFIPFVKDLEGEKIIIEDNLSSHININVLRLCDLHKVKFACLPPNSTYLTQPLNVAFFAPMKESKSGSRYPTIPKDVFPALLKELMESLKPSQGKNLKAGFEKCGIVLSWTKINFWTDM